MSMHSDPAAIQKAMRTYFMVGGALLVGTVLTVGANQLHLTGGLAIAVALLIATIKGSLVAAIFMHLNHEKGWIYGSLIITVVFYAVLILLPNFTVADSIGTPKPFTSVGAHSAEHEKAEK
jgi:cytochrome c oxidase subunit 4